MLCKVTHWTIPGLISCARVTRKKGTAKECSQVAGLIQKLIFFLAKKFCFWLDHSDSGFPANEQCSLLIYTYSKIVLSTHVTLEVEMLSFLR